MTARPVTLPVVLCVDDEVEVLEGIERSAAFHAEIVVATGSARALELLEEGLRPAVIITDMGLPGLSGAKLLAIVRERWPTIVRVMLTGDQTLGVALEAINSGHVFQLLHKPCEPSRLTGAIERAVQEHLRLCEQEAFALEDPLTGVGNRRAFNQGLTRAHASAERYGRNFSVVMIDVDYFKAYNDRLGHVAGDAVLRSTAAALRQTCRLSDELFRYGGEEFAVILNETPVEGALVAAERFRSSIEALGIVHPESAMAVVTASLGVAEHVRGGPMLDVLQQADARLYEAKKDGRNRVRS